MAFKFERFHVEEVLVQGPDGIVFAMMQRYAPPLEGYPNLREMSHIFNSTQIVKDVDLAFEFTRLIVAQRGFSANARTVTVSEEVLEELTNIIR